MRMWGFQRGRARGSGKKGWTKKKKRLGAALGVAGRTQREQEREPRSRRSAWASTLFFSPCAFLGVCLLTNVVQSGWLTKEGGGFKSWKKRWFWLKDGCLHYSKTKNGKDLGVIRLENATHIKADSSARPKKKNVFEIPTPDRTYFLCADTQEDRDEWIALCQAAKKAEVEKYNPSTKSAAKGGAAGGKVRGQQLRLALFLTRSRSGRQRGARGRGGGGAAARGRGGL